MRIAIDALAGSIADGRHDNDFDLSWLYGMTQLGSSRSALLLKNNMAQLPEWS